MIGIIKIGVIVYLTLSLLYFLLTGISNIKYSVKYSSTTWAKIYSVCWIIGFSAVMGVAVANVSTVMGVAKASISKVMGV